MRGESRKGFLTKAREAVEERIVKSICTSCEEEIKTRLRLFFSDCEQQGLTFEKQVQIVQAYADNKRSLTLESDERNVS